MFRLEFIAKTIDPFKEGLPFKNKTSMSMAAPLAAILGRSVLSAWLDPENV
jgi:hypothetical protein